MDPTRSRGKNGFFYLAQPGVFFLLRCRIRLPLCNPNTPSSNLFISSRTLLLGTDLASLEDANTKKKQKEAHTSVAVGDPRPRGGFIPWDKDKGTQSGEIAAFLKLKKALQGSVMSKYPGSCETCVKKGHDILTRKNVKSQVRRRDKKAENLYFGKSGTMLSYKKEVEAGLHGNRPKEDNTMSWAISRQFQLAAAKNGTSYPMPYKGDLDVTEEEPEEEDDEVSKPSPTLRSGRVRVSGPCVRAATAYSYP